ncbi:MAG: sensor histidine kinase [Candidatus Cyclobacteriaceae bacterium M3_2C_046]
MSRNTIRSIIILGTLSIIGIIVTQIHWVRKAYDLKETQFNREVKHGLQSVAHHIYKYNNAEFTGPKVVNQLSDDYFVVKISNTIEKEVLEHLIKREFEKKNLLVDFEFGIYDCHNNKMAYGNYVSFQNNEKPHKHTELPVWAKEHYYFGVFFPTKNIELFKQIGLWSVSSFVVLLVIIFFSYTLFVVFKQKRLSEIQRDFINNMTHEFKTPIATISISSNVLKNPEITHSPHRLKHYANIIDQEANRLKTQVERILQMATAEKEKINLKKEKINLHEIIKNSIKIIHPSLQQKDGQLKMKLGAENPYVLADHLHITNVLYNLMDNAIKYNREKPEIAIETKNQNGSLDILIKDNGIGLAREVQKKIFEKFYRVPTGNVYNVKGFGLGLNYVKVMVKEHRGKIWVDSEIDQGSTFKIQLPTVSSQ